MSSANEVLTKKEDFAFSSDDEEDVQGAELDGLLQRKPSLGADTTGKVPSRSSSRTKKALERFSRQNFESSLQPSGSVFGDPTKVSVRRKRSQISVKQIARDRALRNSRAEELEKLRQDVMQHSALETEEAEEGMKLVAAMAKKEDEEEGTRLKRLEKYQRPLEVFINQPRIPERFKELDVQSNDIFTNLFCEKGRKGDLRLNLESLQNLDQATAHFLVHGQQEIPESLMKGKLLRAIFETVIYDTSKPKDFRDTDCSFIYNEGEGLEGAFRFLTMVLDKWPSLGYSLPSLSRTLADFGADVGTHDEFEVKSMESLDPRPNRGQMEKDASSNPRSTRQLQTLYTMRNLRRALSLYAIIFRGRRKEQAKTITRAEITINVEICARLLASYLGSHNRTLYCSIIDSLLVLVPKNDWVSYRLELAKRIVSVTSRLFVQIEIIQAIGELCKTERSRFLGLECAYHAFYQWTNGHGEDPIPRSFDDLHPTPGAIESGIEIISFTMTQAVDHFEVVSNTDNRTDLAWVSGITQLLQLTICNPDVLKRRTQDDVKRLLAMCDRLRKSLSKFAFSVEVNIARISIDSITNAVKDLSVSNEDDGNETREANSIFETTKNVKTENETGALEDSGKDSADHTSHNTDEVREVATKAEAIEIVEVKRPEG